MWNNTWYLLSKNINDFVIFVNITYQKQGTVVVQATLNHFWSIATISDKNQYQIIYSKTKYK